MKNQTIKTYKNFLNGSYQRSESNITRAVCFNERVCNVVVSTRKDLRNSIQGNRKALSNFTNSSALLKTQIIYRVAENLEARKNEFIGLLEEAKSLNASGKSIHTGNKSNIVNAKTEFNQVLDYLISLAGWPDKAFQLLGSVNPVAGDFLNTTVIEAVGVNVTYLDKVDDPFFKAIEKVILPIINGNTVTLITALEYGPLLQSFGEVLNDSDIPAGVVNILSGEVDSLIDCAASHYDIDLIELSTLNLENKSKVREISARGNLKKVVELKEELNTLAKINLFAEYKSIWQTIGY